jgi:cytochrome P450
LEGPTSGLFSKKRKTVSLNEINIAESRPPSIFLCGYLKLSNGEKIPLGTPLSRREGQEILDEILRRQQNMANAKSDNETNDPCTADMEV